MSNNTNSLFLNNSYFGNNSLDVDCDFDYNEYDQKEADTLYFGERFEELNDTRLGRGILRAVSGVRKVRRAIGSAAGTVSSVTGNITRGAVAGVQSATSTARSAIGSAANAVTSAPGALLRKLPNLRRTAPSTVNIDPRVGLNKFLGELVTSYKAPMSNDSAQRAAVQAQREELYKVIAGCLSEVLPGEFDKNILGTAIGQNLQGLSPMVQQTIVAKLIKLLTEAS